MKNILIIFMISICGYSQSLEQLIEMSIKKNPLLKSFEYKTKAIEKYAESASYLPDPSIQATYFINEIVTAKGLQKAQFVVMQRFPWFGTLSLKSDIIKKSSDVISEKKKQFQVNLINKISMSYYQLASTQEKNQILSNYLELLNGFYQSALSRYENGNGFQQDVLKIQTEISTIKNKRLLLNSMISKSLSKLSRLTYTNIDSLNTSFPDDAFTPLNTFEIHNSHSIQSLLQKKIQSELKQKLTDHKALPKFSLGIKYSLIDEKSGVSGNQDAFGISLGFSLPMWSGKYSDEEESYINESASIDQRIFDKTKEIEEKISFLAFDIREKKRSLDLYKNDLIPKAQMTLQASITAYETGKMSFLNLLDAQRMLLSLELQKTETKKMYHNSISNYKKETTILRNGE